MLDILTNDSWRYKQSKMDIKPSAAVKKCLFGEPAPVSLKSDLNRMMDEIRSNDSKRWNFDFTLGEPDLNGNDMRYEWIKTGVLTPHPAGEDGCKIGSGGAAAAVGLNRGADNLEAAVSVESSPSGAPTAARPASCPLLAPLSRTPSKQLKLSEFFRQKKRSCTPSTEESRVKRRRSNSPERRGSSEARPAVSRSIFRSPSTDSSETDSDSSASPSTTRE